MMDTIAKTINAVKLNMTVKEYDEKLAKKREQKANLDPNKKYILDPFAGYIEIK